MGDLLLPFDMVQDTFLDLLHDDMPTDEFEQKKWTLRGKLKGMRETHQKQLIEISMVGN